MDNGVASTIHCHACQAYTEFQFVKNRWYQDETRTHITITEYTQNPAWNLGNQLRMKKI